MLRIRFPVGHAPHRDIRPADSFSQYYTQVQGFEVNDKEAFVNEIRATPDDDFPRLVYADFLAMHGDHRADLIRLQCKLPTLDVMDPEWRETKDEIKRLLDTYADRWLSPLKEAGALGVTHRSFQRGLVERVVVDIANVETAIGPLCQMEPALQHLEVRCKSSKDLPMLARVDLPSQISTLDLSHNQIPESGLGFIADAPWSQKIEHLILQNCKLTNPQFEPLLPSLPALRGLHLANNALSGPVLDLLTDPPLAGQLWLLDLSTNPIGDARRFERIGETMRELRHLELASCNLGSSQVTKLLKTNGLTKLHTLNLRNNGLKGKAIQAFVTQTAFPKLAKLDLRGNEPVPRRDALDARYPEGFRI